MRVLLLLLLIFVHGSEEKPRIIFANRRDIRILDVVGSGKRSNTSIVVKDLNEATALDINYERDYVCWSDIEAEKIQCQHNNKKTTLVSTALPAPEDLVCDWLTNKLYWSDSETNRIEVVSMDPPYHRKVLIWEEIDQPRALALAPHLGLMFWTDWGEWPKIERAGMNGEDRKVIVEKEIFWPNGIALDLNEEEIYWVDAKLLYIAKVDFQGNNRKEINRGDPKHPFALAFYERHLYWSDWKTNFLHTIKIDGTGLSTLSTKQSLTPMDIVIFEEQALPRPIWGDARTNPCQKSQCSHLCLLAPKEPYFNCACPIGIRLTDEKTCDSQMNSFLLVAKGTDIRRISLDTADFTDVILPFTGIKHILAVDYHIKSGYVFWTDDEARRIRRAQLDGSQQMDVIKEEIVHPDGLAIDWVADNIYWTDAGTDRIEVARLNGGHRKILISRGLQEPRAISVDPNKGLLFWSDWGKRAKIEKSALDGTSRVVVIANDIFWPNGIALDLHSEKIYWCDAKTDKIEMANYDGTTRREILSEALPHTFGFSLLGEYIYWTDWQKRSIERANKLTGGDRSTIKDPFSDPMGLKGVSMADFNFTNPCGTNNGGCAHLCLYKPPMPVCACASGYELEQDNKSCTIPEAFLVFSRDGDLHRISLNRSNHDDVIPVSKVKAAMALDFDTIENRIYWSDMKVKAISRAYMNGSETERVIEWGLQHPEGIAVDWLSRNIYWTDFGRHRIEVAKLNGDHRRTIHWIDIENPKVITLHPAKGWLYWSMWRSPNPTIERSALDGSRRTTFVGKVGRANGLTIDLEDNYLYWTDIDSMSIERVSLNGDKREVIVPTGIYRPSTIAQYQDYIYWSDMASQTIQRANKSFTSESLKLATARDIYDMAIYHKLKQPGWNPCSQANCSHLCFPKPGSKGQPSHPQCGCPTHHTLSQDGSMCVFPTEFLLLSGGSSISRLMMDSNECPDAVVIGGQKRVGGVTWDGRDKVIYWADLKLGNIKRGYENATFGNLFGNDEILKPFDLAFDPLRRIIFWTCESFNSINITDDNGRQLGTILNGKDDRPRHLALNSLKSHLYFSNEGNIERIRLDGMERKVIAKGTGSVNGLTIDIKEEQLYWTDGVSKRIETSDLEGGNRKILMKNLDSPATIAVHGRFVYWAEEKGGVERVEKWTGEERFEALSRRELVSFIISVNDTSQDHKGHRCNRPECSHICLDDGCACPEGLMLADDRRTCVFRMPCGAHEFACTRGSIGCISLLLKCNDVRDCFDGSDEVGCECEFACPCEGGECRQRCLSKEALCDGIEDCPSGWDELSCELPIPIDSSTSTLTTIITPLLIVFAALIGVAIWYCLRTKSVGSIEDSSDPLNPPTTNMTTVNTSETLFHPPSSSIGSSPYCELLVPHPSPATEVRSYCCHGNYAMSYYKGAPPPTPCSTDVCDNSDIYTFAPPPSPHTSSPNSTIRSPHPPPPSPT